MQHYRLAGILNNSLQPEPQRFAKLLDVNRVLVQAKRFVSNAGSEWLRMNLDVVVGEAGKSVYRFSRLQPTENLDHVVPNGAKGIGDNEERR